VRHASLFSILRCRQSDELHSKLALNVVEIDSHCGCYE
jgi:hypothetical protein